MFDLTSDPGEGLYYASLVSNPGDHSITTKVFEGRWGTVAVDVNERGEPVGVEFMTN